MAGGTSDFVLCHLSLVLFAQRDGYNPVAIRISVEAYCIDRAYGNLHEGRRVGQTGQSSPRKVSWLKLARFQT